MEHVLNIHIHGMFLLVGHMLTLLSLTKMCNTQVPNLIISLPSTPLLLSYLLAHSLYIADFY